LGGLGFGVGVRGSGVQGVEVWGLGFGVRRSKFGVRGFWGWGLGFVGLGLRVWDLSDELFFFINTLKPRIG